MRYLSFFFILSLFIGFWVLANNFLANQFALLLDSENVGQLRLICWSVTIFTLFGLPMSVNARNRIGQLMYWTSTTFLGFFIYITLSFLTLTLLKLVIYIPNVEGGLMALGLAISITAYGIWNAFNIRLTELEISIKGLKKDIRAVHLSDIHIGHIRGKQFLQKVVDKTNAQSPDVIFITGDLFDGRINLEQDTLSPFTKLNAPTFFVEGNHDHSTGIQIVKEFVRNTGVHVLENQITHWNGLQIIGLNHMAADESRFNVHTVGRFQTIQNTLDAMEIDEKLPTILLHHSPDGIKYASKHHVNLYLTGHTHAGQLFPAIFFAARMFDYNRGLHQFENTKILVSEGIGTFGPPMRVATKSEVICITLKAG